MASSSTFFIVTPVNPAEHVRQVVSRKQGRRRLAALLAANTRSRWPHYPASQTPARRGSHNTRPADRGGWGPQSSSCCAPSHRDRNVARLGLDPDCDTGSHFSPERQSSTPRTGGWDRWEPPGCHARTAAEKIAGSPSLANSSPGQGYKTSPYGSPGTRCPAAPH